ncbi:MAG: MATE family efflux transporter [Spirochaetia bacterium]
MAGNLIQTVYNLTDTFFLGKLGTEYVSAPAISFPVLMFLIVFGMGIAMAGTTLIAQSKGKQDQKKIDFYLGQMTSFMIIVGVFLSVIGLVLSGPLLRLLHTPDVVFPHAAGYMRIIFAGIPFMFGFFIMQAAMQGIGKTMVPLVVQTASVFINIPLDALLIFGWGPVPGLAVEGAAIATVISRALASLAAFIILIQGKYGMVLTAGNLLPKKNALKLFIKIGLPASVGQGLSSLGFAVLQGVVNLFGTPVIAAFGVGNRLLSVFNMPSMGVGRAVTALVGERLGAGDRDGAMRTVRVGIATVFSILVPGMLFMFFFGGDVIKFFVDDPEAIRWGAILFQIVAPSVVLFGGFMILTGAFQGAGDSKPVMYLNIARLWGVRVPLAYVLALGASLGPIGIWIAMFISNFTASVAGFIYYKKEIWMEALGSDEV